MACVTIDAIDTRCTIVAQISRTVVDVALTICTSKSWWANTLVIEGIYVLTVTTIYAGTRVARNVLRFTILSSIASAAFTPVRSDGVDAPSVYAKILPAFVYVCCTSGARVPFGAGTAVAVLHRLAGGTVTARLRGTVIG